MTKYNNIILLKEIDYDDLDILIILKNENDFKKFEELFEYYKTIDDIGITEKLENMQTKLDFEYFELEDTQKIYW